MDKMLYIAMSSLKQNMRAQAINANNLSNLSTSGFRADLLTYQDAQVHGAGYSSRTYSVTDGNGIDFTQGTIVKTSNELDMAIRGDGLYAVQAADGREGYTRSGTLQITPSGQLLTRAGHPVIGNGGPITVPPADKISIGDDGTISIIPQGQSVASLAVIDRIKLVKPANNAVVKGSNGLFYMKDKSNAVADASVTVAAGHIETSNVNVVEAMANMIDLSRNFEMQRKLMKKAEDMDGMSTKLLSLS